MITHLMALSSSQLQGGKCWKSFLSKVTSLDFLLPPGNLELVAAAHQISSTPTSHGNSLCSREHQYPPASPRRANKESVAGCTLHSVPVTCLGWGQLFWGVSAQLLSAFPLCWAHSHRPVLSTAGFSGGTTGANTPSLYFSDKDIVLGAMLILELDKYRANGRWWLTPQSSDVPHRSFASMQKKHSLIVREYYTLPYSGLCGVLKCDPALPAQGKQQRGKNQVHLTMRILKVEADPYTAAQRVQLSWSASECLSEKMAYRCIIGYLMLLVFRTGHPRTPQVYGQEI